MGILKRDIVGFYPPLPGIHKEMIDKLGFGLMNKVIVAFEKPFWEGNPAWISLAC